MRVRRVRRERVYNRMNVLVRASHYQLGDHGRRTLDLQSISRSLHSCALLFLGRAIPLSPDPAIWLVCTKLSVWKLERLLPSSSVVLGDLDDAEGTRSDCEPTVRPKRSAFCC